MAKHQYTLYFGPTRPYFSWSLTDNNIKDVMWDVFFACKYCMIQHTDGRPSDLLSVTCSLDEEQSQIRRLRITFDMTVSENCDPKTVEKDIDDRLAYIYEKCYKNWHDVSFSTSCDSMWNPPTIFGDISGHYLEEWMREIMMKENEKTYKYIASLEGDLQTFTMWCDENK